jgi:DNA-binding MarR family transcriptional regulator
VPQSPSRKRGLGASLRLAHHLYGKLLQEQLRETGLSMAQYIHLRCLREEGKLKQSELSGLLGIEKASSTRVLDELEKRDLITRNRSQSDRTDSGLRRIDGAMKSARLAADHASTGFEPDELGHLFAAMDKLLDNLASACCQSR